MGADANNVLIRNLSEVDKEILSELRAHFKENTNTQTTLKTLRNYKKLLEKNKLLEQMNAALQEDNNELRQKINNLRDSLQDLQI